MTREKATAVWEGTRVVVVGLGGSGRAAARLLVGKDASVLVSEAEPEPRYSDVAAELRALGVECEFGGHTVERFTAADAVVLSPGVPQSIDAVAAACRAGVRVISELELAYQYRRAPVVGVTGTNGKTTTCTLVHLMLERAGKRAVYTGNTDMPFSEVVMSAPEPDVYVVEVSSFQLELTATFRPEVGILLNVTPDHLDRYRGFDHYAATKLRLFEYQQPTDFAVVNALDPHALAVPLHICSQRVYFDINNEVETGCWAAGDSIRYRLRGEEGTVCSTAELRLPGAHNLENALAACIGAMLMGARPEHCAAVLRDFTGLSHRLETVAEIAGVTYVNDSKSTNIDSLRRALAAFDEPIVLIAGGRGKGERYDSLRPLVEQHVRTLVLIGEEAGAMDAQMSGREPAHRASSLEEAVRTAAGLARPGDVVLLSPGCASFDMFVNFKHRGSVFKDSVRALEDLCDAKHT